MGEEEKTLKACFGGWIVTGDVGLEVKGGKRGHGCEVVVNTSNYDCERIYGDLVGPYEEFTNSLTYHNLLRDNTKPIQIEGD